MAAEISSSTNTAITQHFHFYWYLILHMKQQVGNFKKEPMCFQGMQVL